MKKGYKTPLFMKLTIGVAVILVLGVSIYALQKLQGNGANPNMTDNEIIQDLALLEKAIWDYGKLLPEDLSDVKANGLKGNLQDYDYRITEQYQGGPNESFVLCTAFHSRSPKLDDPGFQYYYYYNSPEGYGYHRSGKQCFSVGWNIHGGAASITVMENAPDWVKT